MKQDNILSREFIKAHIDFIEPVNSFEIEGVTMYTFDVEYTITKKGRAQYISKTSKPLGLVEGSDVRVILEEKLLNGKNGEFIAHRIRPAQS